MKFLSLLFCSFAPCASSARRAGLMAHGFAGARFFPATLSTDDPFVSDELSLPTVSTIRTPEDGGTRETDISMDISKRITRNLRLKSVTTFTALNPHEGRCGEWVRQSGVRREVSAAEKRRARSDCLDWTWRGSRWHRRALGRRRFIQHLDAGNFLRQRLWRFTRGRAAPEAVRHHRTGRHCDSDQREHAQCHGGRPDRRTARLRSSGIPTCWSGALHWSTPDLPAITGAGHWTARAIRSVDSAGGVCIGNSAEPRRGGTNDWHDKPWHHLGG